MEGERDNNTRIDDSLKRSVRKRRGQSDIWAVIRTAQQSSDGKKKGRKIL